MVIFLNSQVNVLFYNQESLISLKVQHDSSFLKNSFMNFNTVPSKV